MGRYKFVWDVASLCGRYYVIFIIVPGIFSGLLVQHFVNRRPFRQINQAQKLKCNSSYGLRAFLVP